MIVLFVNISYVLCFAFALQR